MRKRRTDIFKPPKFKDFLTLRELCDVVNRDPSRIRRLEALGRLPRPARVQIGAISVRLYSPVEVEEIQTIISGLKSGRPKGGKNG